MTDTRKKRPRDVSQRAKMIVDIATGESDDPNDAERTERGRAGGLKGGVARARALDPQTRREIARKAANARWGKKRS